MDSPKKQLAAIFEDISYLAGHAGREAKNAKSKGKHAQAAIHLVHQHALAGLMTRIGHLVSDPKDGHHG